MTIRPGSVVFWMAFGVVLLLLHVWGELLFHTVVELFAVAVALGIVSIVRNTRRFHDEGWLVVLGVAFPFVGALDLAHALTYPGLGFGGDVQSSAQLWFAARAAQALVLLLALATASARVNGWAFVPVFGTYVAVVLVAVLQLDSFPVCVDPGGRPTPFRIAGSVGVMAVLAVGGGALWGRRDRFTVVAWFMLGLSLGFAVLSELAGVLSTGLGDGPGVVAHLLKLGSFAAVYRAVIDGALASPYEALRQAVDAPDEQRSGGGLDSPTLGSRTDEMAQLNHQLAEAERRYRTVADFTFDWEAWEDPVGTLQYVSPSCRRITGYLAEEFIADPALVDRLVIPDDRALWLEHRSTESAQQAAGAVRVRIRRVDGAIRWIEHVCQPVVDGQGRSHGIRASNRYITHAVEADEAVRRARDELTHLQRVSTAGELTAQLAHEINQPLAGIMSNAQAAISLLQSTDPDVAEIRAALDDIVSDDRRASEVVARIRNMLKKGPRHRSSVDVNDAVMEVLSMLRGQMTDGRTNLTLDLTRDLPRVLADRVQVQQVVMNLVRNALDALHDVSEPRLVLTTRRSDGWVQVRVQDNGDGIPADLPGDVFEPFLSSKDGGLGMGLAISRSIVEEHGGRLWVEEGATGGATLCFELQVWPGEAAEIEAERRQELSRGSLSG